MIKVFVSCCLAISSILVADTIVYTQNDIHAFLPKDGKLSVRLGYEAMNDTLDIFNIKEREFGATTQNLDALGDLEGFDLAVGYSFYDDFYLHANVNQKYLQYSGSTLQNTRFDIYLRYELYESVNLSLSVDGGYVLNKAEDLYLYDIDTINKNLKKLAPSADVKISADGKILTYQDADGVSGSSNLTLKPYAAIIDTDDDAFYFRVISSFKTESLVFDVFAGYEQIAIQYTVDSSLAHEPGLKEELQNRNFAQLSDTREDALLFVGGSARYQLGSLYGTFGYKYNNILRIEGLQEILTNHIINLDLFYAFNSSFGVYGGVQVMSNQFNGEIPYLYTQYSQSTFDHPYGYISLGTVLKF